MINKRKMAAIIVTLLLLPGVSHALTEGYGLGATQQKALVGLKGVEVAATGARVNPQAERLGLTQDQIQTDVELRLRKAGVRVLTKEEKFATPGQPDLAVTVTPHLTSGLCFYVIQVQVREPVTLASGFETGGIIWESTAMGVVGITDIREIRKVMGDQVDKFINDYLAANPKK